MKVYYDADCDINLITGNRKKISLLMYILAALFVLKYFLI